MRSHKPVRSVPVAGRIRRLALALLAQVISCYAFAEEATNTPATGTAFIPLLTSQTRKTFDEINDFLRKHPKSLDAPPAADWVLRTAREFAWEADTSDVTTLVLEQLPPEGELQLLAQEVATLGAARRGDVAGADAAFGTYLRGLRLRQPNRAAGLAQSLALVWQLRGEPQSARAVYDQLSGAFFLNEEIRDFAANRTQRLELLGKEAPGFSETDLSGEAFDWGVYRGKRVLVDFWATNCRPCLEELPNLKLRQAEFAPLGVEFLGISFDDDVDLLRGFVAEQHIPWRQIQGRGTAREQYHVELIPCLMVVDGEGRVVAVDVRPADVRWCLHALPGGAAVNGN